MKKTFLFFSFILVALLAYVFFKNGPVIQTNKSNKIENKKEVSINSTQNKINNSPKEEIKKIEASRKISGCFKDIDFQEVPKDSDGLIKKIWDKPLNTKIIFHWQNFHFKTHENEIFILRKEILPGLDLNSGGNYKIYKEDSEGLSHPVNVDNFGLDWRKITEEELFKYMLEKGEIIYQDLVRTFENSQEYLTIHENQDGILEIKGKSSKLKKSVCQFGP